MANKKATTTRKRRTPEQMIEDLQKQIALVKDRQARKSRTLTKSETNLVNAYRALGIIVREKATFSHCALEARKALEEAFQIADLPLPQTRGL